MSNLKTIVSILKSKYNNGFSLVEIFNELHCVYGETHATLVFSEFVKTNKNNVVFMKEFNESSFI